MRGWLRVTLSKHLFQHRYDYRAEWLRFTDTIGRAGPTAAPLRERIVQAVADIADSPKGVLLTPREEGGLALDARWQWQEIEVPAEALSAQAMRFFEESQFILDLDDIRRGQLDEIPPSASRGCLPQCAGRWFRLSIRAAGVCGASRSHGVGSLGLRLFRWLAASGAISPSWQSGPLGEA